MDSILAVVVEILEPYIGGTLASTCVRGTALSLGKTSDELGPEDLPALRANIEKVLVPVASRATVDKILQELEVRGA